jgi:demethylmenaquinone methyltransferase/2-methoxy-6-polyprenyl-1,4-benzoquinol methylase
MAGLTGAARQRYVADLFARISGHYDLMNDVMTLGMHRGWKRRTAALATQALHGPALDVSTGTGDLAFQLARRPGVNSTVGLDLLPEMIALARSRAPRQQADNISLMLGDALSLPFPDQTFACATAGFSLRNMPDARQAISEMARVVQPGGRVALLELSPMETGVKARLFRLYFHGIVPLVGSLIARDRAAYTYLPQSVDRFYDADELATVLREAGLENVGYGRLGCGAVCLHWGDKPLIGSGDGNSTS